MVAFGGAGPLHACELAEALGIDTVIVPARAGVLSAVGILTAPVQRDLVRPWPTPLDHHGLDQALVVLAGRVADLVGPGATVTTSVDCRYRGQSHELTVPDVAGFEAEHARRNGYTRSGDAIEVVALRATAMVEAPLSIEHLPPVERSPEPLVGPTAIVEPDCTVWLAEGWRADPGAAGALLLRREQPR